MIISLASSPSAIFEILNKPFSGLGLGSKANISLILFQELTFQGLKVGSTTRLLGIVLDFCKSQACLGSFHPYTVTQPFVFSPTYFYQQQMQMPLILQIPAFVSLQLRQQSLIFGSSHGMEEYLFFIYCRIKILSQECFFFLRFRVTLNIIIKRYSIELNNKEFKSYLFINFFSWRLRSVLSLIL